MRRLFIAAIIIVGAISFLVSTVPLTYAQSQQAQQAQQDKIRIPPPEEKFGYFNCLENFPNCSIYLVTYVIWVIVSFLIVIGAWLIALALTVSQGIINSPAVRTGYTVTLSFANLGFVLAIIVIAIATILRSQTYGMKQTLWKLVVAAVLVNFSLVISGTVIVVSDQLTGHFRDQIYSSNQPMNVYTDRLAEGFSPQTLTLSKDVTNFSTPGNPWLTGTSYAVATATCLGLIAKAAGVSLASLGTLVPVSAPVAVAGCAGTFVLAYMTDWLSSPTNFENFIRLLLAMIFGIIFGFLISLTFIALGVMLIIRYVYLSILLIIAPLAWLLWIFPNFKSSWDKWWHTFLRWTFFAPIMLFFLYLSLLVAINHKDYLEYYTHPTNIPPGFDFARIIQAGAEKIVIIGLAIGGIFAANALSITGAGLAMNAAKTSGKWAGMKVSGKAWRGAKQVASYPLSRPFGREKLSAMERMTRYASQHPLATRLGLGRIATVGTRIATAGGLGNVAHWDKWASKQNVQTLLAAATSATGAKQIAIMKRLKEAEALDKANMMHYMSAPGRKRMWERFQQKGEFENLEKASGASAEMWKALKEGNEEVLRKEARKFFSKLSSADMAKLQANDIFSGKAGFGASETSMIKLSQHIAYAIATSNKTLFPSLISKLGGNQLNALYNEIVVRSAPEDSLDQKLRDAVANGELTDINVTDEASRQAFLNEIQQIFKDTMMNKAAWSGAPAAAPAAAPAPAPGGPHS